MVMVLGLSHVLDFQLTTDWCHQPRPSFLGRFKVKGNSFKISASN